MKKCGYALILLFIAIGAVCLASMANLEASEKTGEQLFKEHCAICHPDGGNIINPKKTLLKKDLDTNNIKKTEDAVKIMRKPGPGMTTFDVKSLSDKDARMIADYMFKKLNK